MTQNPRIPHPNVALADKAGNKVTDIWYRYWAGLASLSDIAGGGGGNIPWTVAGGTSDALTATYTPRNLFLPDALLLSFRASMANATTTPTFSPDGLPAAVITKHGDQALVAGDIQPAAEILIRYDITTNSWEILNSLADVDTGGSSLPWAVAGGTSDVITAAYAPAIAALTDGLLLGFRATAANATTTPTFSPNGLTAHVITKDGGAVLAASDIPAGNAEVLIRYNLANTRWELLNPQVAAAAASGVVPWTIAGGTANAITAAYTPPNGSLTDGLLLSFRATAANSITNPTFAPDGLTAHPITKDGGSALASADIPGALAEVLVRYNLANTRWELLNPQSMPSAGTVVPWAVAGGTANAITATYAPPNASLTDGLLLSFRALGPNTIANPTFSPDGLTAHTITKYGGAALVGGDISAALAEMLVRYNLAHTRWELLNPQSVVAAGAGSYFINVTSAPYNAVVGGPAAANVTAIQAAINAAQGGSNGIYLPGMFSINAPLVVSGSLEICGLGIDSGLQMTSTTQDAIQVTGSGAVNFHSFSINGNAGQTAGAAINCNCSAENDGSVFHEMWFTNIWFGLEVLKNLVDWEMYGCRFSNIIHQAIHLENQANTGRMNCGISLCTFRNATNSGVGNAINLLTGGAWRIVSNKIIACANGIIANIAAAGQTDLIIGENSIEGLSGNGITVQTAAGATFGNVHIVHNQFANFSSPGSVYIGFSNPNANTWCTGLQIMANNIGYPALAGGAAATVPSISIDGCTVCTVVANVIYSLNGTVVPVGIQLSSHTNNGKSSLNVTAGSITTPFSLNGATTWTAT